MTTTYVANTSTYPYSAVVRVFTTFSDGTQISGSGAVVGPNDVLTATHVVTKPGKTTVKVEIVPGQNGTKEPFGRFTAEYIQPFAIDADGDGKLSYEDSKGDFAVLGFSQRISKLTGYFGYMSTYSGYANVTGYPGVYGGNLMTNDYNFVDYNSDYGILDTASLDINPGNSGGPIWTVGPLGKQIVGVVSTADSAAAVGNINWNTVVGWIAANDYLIASTPPPAPTPTPSHNEPTDSGGTHYGTSGPNVIKGLGGGDVIYGRGGDDALYAGPEVHGNGGGNRLYGEDGNDRLYGDGFEDSLYGGNGDDALFGDSGNDELYGEDGDDRLDGGSGEDKLNGGVGDDWLYGGETWDTLTGGAGSDTFVIDDQADWIVDFTSGVDSIYLGGDLANADVEWVRLSSTQFHRYDWDIDGLRHALSVPDFWERLDSDDYVVYVVDRAFTYLAFDPDGGGPFGPTDYVYLGEPGVSRSGQPPSLSYSDIWIPKPIARPTEGDDSLDGTIGNDTIDPRGGSDSVDGGPGDDSLKGGSGDDEILAGAGNDSVDGGLDDDTLDGGAGDDTLSGGAGNDVLYGGYDVDFLDGGAGTDVAVYFYDATEYFVLRRADGSVEMAFDSTDVTEPLKNIEIIRFGGMFGEDSLISDISTNMGDDGRDVFIGTEEDDTLDAKGGNDDLDGQGGNDSLLGNSGNDRIKGGEGNDTLTGGTGTDRMEGGLGDDTYDVDNSGDRVIEIASEGTDFVKTSLASYSLAALAHVENLAFDKGTRPGDIAFTGTGNSANNHISGGAGNDKLNGGRGDDTLIGGIGNDTLIGGDATGFIGSDTVVLSGNLADYTFSRVTDTALNPTVLATRGSEVDTLVGIERIVFANVAAGRLLSKGDLLLNTGSPFEDTYLDDDKAETVTSFSGLSGNDLARGGARANDLNGGDGNDSLAGGAGNDTLVGGTGKDSLDGGAGDDSLIGGKGDDSYVVDAEGDAVSENALEGTDTINTSLATYNLADKAAQVEKLIYTGTAAFTGTGNSLANLIQGSDGNDSLQGMEGNDRLFGGAGKDTLDGGTGSDQLNGGDGDDTYLIDRAYVPANADLGTPESGDRVIDASGTDSIETQLGSLNLAYYAAVENLSYTGTGNFTGAGNGSNNAITGQGGNDRLNGGAGDDTLLGGLGADWLNGGAGNDHLRGGDGADTLTGSVGEDVFVFETMPDSNSIDLITDFRTGVDRLSLDAGIFGVADFNQPGLLVSNLADMTADTRLIYQYDAQTRSGMLYYDDDGLGEHAMVAMAKLAGLASLAATDFMIGVS